MSLREELNLLYKNLKDYLKELYEKAKLHPLISLIFIIAVGLLVAIPYVQVHLLSGMTNNTEMAKQENQNRTTLAQIFGGVTLGIGLYYTWRRITIAEEELKVSKESQITERFTRAIDQLGNPAIEIRLGGIHALERIAN